MDDSWWIKSTSLTHSDLDKRKMVVDDSRWIKSTSLTHSDLDKRKRVVDNSTGLTPSVKQGEEGCG